MLFLIKLRTIPYKPANKNGGRFWPQPDSCSSKRENNDKDL